MLGARVDLCSLLLFERSTNSFPWHNRCTMLHQGWDLGPAGPNPAQIPWSNEPVDTRFRVCTTIVRCDCRPVLACCCLNVAQIVFYGTMYVRMAHQGWDWGPAGPASWGMSPTPGAPQSCRRPSVVLCQCLVSRCFTSVSNCPFM